MSPTRASVKGFLATARKALLSPAAQRPSPLTLVVGNESADLDSLCSAVLFAYFRTHTPPHTLHIPLSNLPRADLALRPELTAALSPAGLQPDDLITLSELPREDLDPQDTRWFLVDHNALTGDLAARFAGQVAGCIDHHDDEGAVPPDGEPRIITPCGSCASLVLGHCRDAWDGLAATPCDDGTPAAACDAHLARLALAPILIDTTNLTSADKTTDRDVRAAALAESKLLHATATATASPSPSPSPSPSLSAHPQPDQDATAAARYDRSAYYTALTQLKQQVRGLSYRDVLRKDYKRWGEGGLAVGVSAVARDLAGTVAEAGDGERASFFAALAAWAGEQALDVAAVMTASSPGGVFARELLVWGRNERGVRAVRVFVERFAARLGLEPWNGGELDAGGEGEAEWRVGWRQRELKYSRKQVAPMLREAMRESSRL